MQGSARKFGGFLVLFFFFDSQDWDRLGAIKVLLTLCRFKKCLGIENVNSGKSRLLNILPRT